MFLYIKKEEGSSLEVQWLRLHGSNAGGQGAGGRREREKKTLQLKKKKFPLATGTICSGLCLWDSRESVASGRE